MDIWRFGLWTSWKPFPSYSSILAIVTHPASRRPDSILREFWIHKRQLTALNLSTFKPIPNEPYPSQSSKQLIMKKSSLKVSGSWVIQVKYWADLRGIFRRKQSKTNWTPLSTICFKPRKHNKQTFSITLSGRYQSQPTLWGAQSRLSWGLESKSLPPKLVEPKNLLSYVQNKVKREYLPQMVIFMYTYNISYNYTYILQ